MNWLHGAMSYDLDLATKPVDKALFALLRVCKPQTVDVDNVLRVAQAFEALFAGGREGIGAILQERLMALLGELSGRSQLVNEASKLT